MIGVQKFAGNLVGFHNSTVTFLYIYEGKKLLNKGLLFLCCKKNGA